jgi:hypothetical protein
MGGPQAGSQPGSQLGPGSGPGRDRASRQGQGGAPTREEVIDLRRESDADRASRVIAEWLGTGQRPPELGGAAGAAGAGNAGPGGIDQAVRDARRAAEEAIEQRVVPGRAGPLVRRYFDRLPRALRGGAGETPASPPTSTPASGPASGPASAPAATPTSTPAQGGTP